MAKNGFSNRFPMNDGNAESRRVDSYWEWLELNKMRDTACPVVRVGNVIWKQLKTPQDADYEARYMRHSIGHSWDKYSAFGDIYSLRNFENIPEVTILVSDDKVIHAREQCNARLSENSMSALKMLCHYADFTIVPDQHAFEAWVDGDGENTRLNYLLRTNEGKEFTSLTILGRMSQEQLAGLLASNSALFTPSLSGLPGEGIHEMLSISLTGDEHDVHVTPEGFCAAWTEDSSYKRS